MQSGQIYYERCCFRCYRFCCHSCHCMSVCDRVCVCILCNPKMHYSWTEQLSMQIQNSYSKRIVHSVDVAINAFVVVLLPANKQIKFDAIDSLISCGDAVVNFGQHCSLFAFCTAHTHTHELTISALDGVSFALVARSVSISQK